MGRLQTGEIDFGPVEVAGGGWRAGGAAQGNENLVRLFLYHCADVHRQDKDKCVLAMGRRDARRHRAHVQRGVRPRRGHGQASRNTALHWACTRGDLTVVQLLVEFDAAVNLPEKGGWYTPFHWAGMHRRPRAFLASLQSAP